MSSLLQFSLTRGVVSSASLIASVAFLAAPASQAATLKIETYAGPKHSMNTTAWPQWIKQVEGTKADVKVRISYPPINPRDLYDRVREGIADISWSGHGYTTGRFVLTDMIELPGMDGNAEQMSVAFWRIYTKHFMKFDEHKGVKLLALFAHGPGMVHSRKPITSIDVLNGMKVRTGAGTQSAIAKRLGIVSVSAPVTKAQEILAQGVADGVFFSIETIWSFRLGGVVKYHYSVPGGLYTSSFFAVMNQKKYDGLSAPQKKAIDGTTGESLSRLIGATWDGADKIAVTELTKNGNKVADFDAKMAAAIKGKLAGLDAAWIARAKKEGVADPAAVLKELRAEVQKVKK